MACQINQHLSLPLKVLLRTSLPLALLLWAGVLHAQTPPITCSTDDTAVTHADLVNDCGWLLSMEKTWVGEGPDDTLNWDKGTAMDSWTGITVSGNRVTAISFDVSNNGTLRNNLQGRIPPEIGYLDALTYLGYNNANDTKPLGKLSGPLPASVGNLQKLITIDIFNTALGGPIPRELGDLPALEDLSLQITGLTGPIPRELGDLGELGILALTQNNLSGPIPSSLGELSKLRNLHLGSNNLSGNITASLGKLEELNQLFLHNNPRLTGSLPDWWGEDGTTDYSEDPNADPVDSLESLSQLRLYNTNWKGTLPVGLRNISTNPFQTQTNRRPKPPVALSLPIRTMSANFGFALPAFTDPDENETLNYRATYRATDTEEWGALPAGWEFDADALTISGILPEGQQRVQFRLTATDETTPPADDEITEDNPYCKQRYPTGENHFPTLCGHAIVTIAPFVELPDCE